MKTRTLLPGPFYGALDRDGNRRRSPDSSEMPDLPKAKKLTSLCRIVDPASGSTRGGRAEKR
jgi:hypothetical protein